MCKAMEVAGYITNSLEVDKLKLQKLLFYSQAVHVVFNDELLFDDEIQAWDYGPVVPKIYKKLKNKEGIVKLPYKSTLTEKQIHSIDLALGYYGDMSGAALINETHSESTWINAYKKGRNTPIVFSDIKECYGKIYEIEKQ